MDGYMQEVDGVRLVPDPNLQVYVQEHIDAPEAVCEKLSYTKGNT